MAASKGIKKDSPSYIKGDMIKDKNYGKVKGDYNFNQNFDRKQQKKFEGQ